MKIRTLASTLAAAFSATAFAAAPAHSARPLNLAEMVTHMEASYPGEVVAIKFDDSGDKPAHYHVDMRFLQGGIASVDVDAATLAIAARDAGPQTPGSATLAYATALVATYVPGHVIVAELDSSEGTAPHYDVDVRLPDGEIARLKVDPVKRELAWRTPAILAD